jgi:hypothetical protein
MGKWVSPRAVDLRKPPMCSSPASMANAMAYPRIVGVLGHACLPRQRRDGGWSGEERALVQGAVKYRTGAYTDELDNRPERHHTDSDLRGSHTAPGEQGEVAPR